MYSPPAVSWCYPAWSNTLVSCYVTWYLHFYMFPSLHHVSPAVQETFSTNQNAPCWCHGDVIHPARAAPHTQPPDQSLPGYTWHWGRTSSGQITWLCPSSAPVLSWLCPGRTTTYYSTKLTLGSPPWAASSSSQVQLVQTPWSLAARSCYKEQGGSVFSVESRGSQIWICTEPQLSAEPSVWFVSSSVSFNRSLRGFWGVSGSKKNKWQTVVCFGWRSDSQHFSSSEAAEDRIQFYYLSNYLSIHLSIIHISVYIQFNFISIQ